MPSIQASEIAYQFIRDAILDGTYAEGDRLPEVDLARGANVSRTPVREALRRLAAEGFVQIRSGAGAVVSRWTHRRIADLFEIRASLEGLGAGLAAARATRDDIAELENLCSRMDFASNRDAPKFLEDFSALNTAFHVGILRISDNGRLEELAGSMMSLGVIMLTYNRFDTRRVAQSCADHRNILAALKSGNAGRAEATMRAHILSSIDLYLDG